MIQKKFHFIPTRYVQQWGDKNDLKDKCFDMYYRKWVKHDVNELICINSKKIKHLGFESEISELILILKEFEDLITAYENKIYKNIKRFEKEFKMENKEFDFKEKKKSREKISIEYLQSIKKINKNSKYYEYFFNIFNLHFWREWIVLFRDLKFNEKGRKDLKSQGRSLTNRNSLEMICIYLLILSNEFKDLQKDFDHKKLIDLINIIMSKSKYVKTTSSNAIFDLVKKESDALKKKSEAFGKSNLYVCFFPKPYFTIPTINELKFIPENKNNLFEYTKFQITPDLELIVIDDLSIAKIEEITTLEKFIIFNSRRTYSIHDDLKTVRPNFHYLFWKYDIFPDLKDGNNFLTILNIVPWNSNLTYLKNNIDELYNTYIRDFILGQKY